ncbi:MAG: hypothetical protein AAGD05_19210, partial [Bacteroidota bacterium]
LLWSILCLFVIAHPLDAQNEVDQHFTIASDPFTPILSGYHFELGYQFGKNRLASSISRIEVPSFYNSQHEDVVVTRNHVDWFYTRFLRSDQTGFHFGGSVGYVYEEKVEQKEGNMVLEDNYLRAGLRLGYFWFPFRDRDNGLSGIYIEPTINLGFALNNEDLVFPNLIYEAEVLKISGPIFHLGYRF